MKVRVFVQCGPFVLVNEEITHSNTTVALIEAMQRPGVASHLQDLHGKPIRAEVSSVQEGRMEAAAPL